jgi:SsrA-binding protein
MYIAKYKEGNQFNHDERRTRKLLLHKSEIRKLREKIEREGYSLVPIKLYFKGQNAKILLGVGRGKKLYDKRETIKERDLKRENERINHI